MNPENIFTRALKRAKQVEDRLRESAFLPIPETINGIKVDQLRLKYLTILFSIESPFLIGGVPSYQDVLKFMWIVSGRYNAEGKGRKAFLEKICHRDHGDRFFRAISRYLDRALMDRPPITPGGRKIPSSFAAAIIHKLAGAYGWKDEDILEMPMARIYQYLKWIAAENNPEMPQFSPMVDRVKNRIFVAMNKDNGHNDHSAAGS